jgi:WD40 repeat protein
MDRTSVGPSAPRSKLYKAFISYSHATDEELASALQAALHAFGRPWNRLRAIRVFRDRTNLSANPDLWAGIERAIGESEWFLLMASPGAAQSDWVRREITTFLQRNQSDRVLLVLTDGEVTWDSASIDFDWQRTNAFPNLGWRVFQAEPLHLDLRSARRGSQLSLRDPAFHDAIADLSSTLRDIDKDELVGRDVQEHRKRRLFLRAGVSALILLTLGLGLATSSAIRERNVALQRLVQSYVATGVRSMDDGNLLASLPWLVEALRMERGDSARRRLHRVRLAAVLRKCPELTQVWFLQNRPELLAFNRSGSRVLMVFNAGSPEGWTGEVRDVRTGDVVASMRGDGEVSQATFSPNGRRALTLSSGEVRVWDSATGAGVPFVPQPDTAVVHAEFSADDRYLWAVSQDGAVWRWDMAAGDGRIVMHTAADVARARFSRDQRRLWVMGEDGMMRVWDTSTRQPVSGELSAGKAGTIIDEQRFSPDGRYVALVASQVQEVHLWNVEEPRLRVLTGARQVLDLVFSPDGTRLATASFTGMAQVWEVTTGREITRLLGHRGAVDRVAFSADGMRLLTAGDDDTARVWDIDSGKAVASVLESDDSIVGPQFGPDGNQVVTTRQLGAEIRLWTITDRAGWVRSLRADTLITSAAFDRGGGRLAIASADGAVRIRDMATGTQDLTITHYPAVQSVAFGFDDRYLVTVGSDSTARIWEVRTGAPVGKPLRHDDEVVRAAFTSDGRRVFTVTGNLTERGRLWEAASGEPVASQLFAETGAAGGASHVVFSPDGRSVATVSRQDLEVLEIWDVATGGAAAPPLRIGATVSRARFSPDGRQIVTAAGLQARVWDARSGLSTVPPLMHGTFIDYAEFSPDGRLVVTTSGDHGTVRLWDATTGEPATPLLPSRMPTFAAFSPDGRSLLLVAEESNQVEVWDLTPEHRSVRDLELLAMALTAHRIDDSGGYISLEVDELRQLWRQLRTRVR